MISANLEIDGFGSHALIPFAIDGEEAISTQFHFDVSCLMDTFEPPPGAAFLGRRAVLTIVPEHGLPRRIVGVTESVVVNARALFREPVLRVRIVPAMTRLARSRRYQIYGTEEPMSVSDIISAASLSLLHSGSRADDSDIVRLDSELRLRHDYPKRPHITQFDETDLDFISRLTEHWGIGYFFAPKANEEQVIFFDDPVFMPLLEGNHVLNWSPLAETGDEAKPDTVQRFEAVYTALPRRTVLEDYNELAPHVPLMAAAEVDPDGRGTVIEYGAHYLTPIEGAFLARTRAEELRSDKLRFNGTSGVPGIAPGFVFDLAGHAYTSWDQRYLICSVHHRARLSVPGVSGLAGLIDLAPTETIGYRNSFSAMPLRSDLPFRPARKTAWPRAGGLLNGRIEAATPTSTDPHLNQDGWYRVRLQLDFSDAPRGLASCWVRKAEPYGGPSNGMHFPLPPGTDVVLACVNADPDRLVIVGAAPSADNASMVTLPTSNLNRIQTRSGIRFTMSDQQPPTTGGNEGPSEPPPQN